MLPRSSYDDWKSRNRRRDEGMRAIMVTQYRHPLPLNHIEPLNLLGNIGTSILPQPMIPCQFQTAVVQPTHLFLAPSPSSQIITSHFVPRSILQSISRTGLNAQSLHQWNSLSNLNHVNSQSRGFAQRSLSATSNYISNRHDLGNQNRESGKNSGKTYRNDSVCTSSVSDWKRKESLKRCKGELDGFDSQSKIPYKKHMKIDCSSKVAVTSSDKSRTERNIHHESQKDEDSMVSAATNNSEIKRKSKRKEKKRHRSSSVDSFERSGDDSNERWQYLTEEDLNEVAVSDTDNEVDVEKLVIAESHIAPLVLNIPGFYELLPNGNYWGTPKLVALRKEFEDRVLVPIREKKAAQPKLDPPELSAFHSHCKCGHMSDTDTETEDEIAKDVKDGDINSSDDDCTDNFELLSEAKQHRVVAKREIDRKSKHPAVLHPQICFNEPLQLNDGPVCRCSWKAKQFGFRHNKFVGENLIESCSHNSNNEHRLHHYVLEIDPNPRSFSAFCSSLRYQNHVYEFEGFSVFFHRPLPEVFPQDPLSRWSSEYSIRFVKQDPPKDFCVADLELFYEYLFVHIMEMYDLKRRPFGLNEGCAFYHCMPRYSRSIPNSKSKVLLPMSMVLSCLVGKHKPLLDDEREMTKFDGKLDLWRYKQKYRGSLVINPEKRPSAIRVDDIKYEKEDDAMDVMIVHYGMRSCNRSCYINPEYQKASKEYARLRKTFLSKGRITVEERQRLSQKAAVVRKFREEQQLRRSFVMAVPTSGFYSTGLHHDIVQHAMLLIPACLHVRLHWSLQVFEKNHIRYEFKDRSLLELALTHSSYRVFYGPNVDHARNTLNNCGLRTDKHIKPNRPDKQFWSGKKRGFQTLMHIMSQLGSKKCEQSPLNHNERLEFLGDAVIEFITTIHLFYMFPDLDEGALATYRSAIVQNKNLASLAKKIGIDDFMMFAHGPDLCHESDLRHAMANTFEAVMAAIYLDSGIDECDRIYCDAMFDEQKLRDVWNHLPEHPLKKGLPYGDRHLIKDVPVLQRLSEFEESIGVTFKYIRILAKAFTRKCVGFNNLTLGHNQRLEFLGDTILQLITTDYVYKHFPHHHEGHLSILRTCVVSNKTQSIICDDVGMANYLVIPRCMQKGRNRCLKVKDKADLVEAFIGALYVDRGLAFCKILCRVCFFPRFKLFILSQKWNDPKSQLQQRCLALRQFDGGTPDIPEYRTIKAMGPTNTRVYQVAVYFRGKRLASGFGHTLQAAQMKAAERALKTQNELFRDDKSTERSSKKHPPSEHQKSKSHSVPKAYPPPLPLLMRNTLDNKLPIKSLLDLKFDSDGNLL